MARKGYPVPALENMPVLPEYMGDIQHCYFDLVREGNIQWVDFSKWADEYSLQDREYVWEVINRARQEVDKWQSLKVKSSEPGTPTSQVRK